MSKQSGSTLRGNSSKMAFTFGTIIFIYIIIRLGIAFYNHIERENDDIEIKQIQEKIFEKEKSKLIESQQERTDLEEYNENEFWDLIEEAKSRADDNYSRRVGIIKGKLSTFSAEELIKIDNLIYRLIIDGINLKMLAATKLILNNDDLFYLHQLLSIFMTEGEVFYKNAIYDPDMFHNRSITNLDLRLLQNFPSEIYLDKTKRLLPNIPTDLIENPILDEPIKSEDFIKFFPKLIKRFNI